MDTRSDRVTLSIASAVVCGGRRYSNLQVLSFSSHIVHQFGKKEVGQQKLVGLCLSRSVERIAAMLAIWKVGAAVLALDPAWPAQRLSSIIDDAGIDLLLVDEGMHIETVVRQISLGRIDECAAANNDNAWQLSFSCEPDSLAYVVYTSGSTGAPKGVEISHANLDHLVQWHNTEFRLRGADRVSHVAGLGYDAAFWELCPALRAGATLVLAEEEARSSPVQLQRWLLEEKITCAFVPTILAELLFQLEWPSGTPLRVLLTGGEALKSAPPPGLPFQVYNNYGPSECSVVATSGLVYPGTSGVAPDIGRPISGTQVYLMDGTNLVQDGDVGEIVIGGAGVGRGYRHAAELTSQRFIPDCFQTGAGRRLYRTGDYGRRLPDGCIAFVGRIDEQEQIRGVRVEPDEIARALRTHPDVEWCAIVGHNAVQGRELSAYLKVRANALLNVEGLRSSLQAVLPEPMIPSNFLQVEFIPLTSSGKLDINTLVHPANSIPLRGAPFRMPSGPVELRLAQIISELLGGLRVGADDNFFLIGGHSLLGTQAVIRVRETFGVQLALRDLFKSPTVAALAIVVTRLLLARLEAMTEKEAEMWLAR